MMHFLWLIAPWIAVGLPVLAVAVLFLYAVTEGFTEWDRLIIWLVSMALFVMFVWGATTLTVRHDIKKAPRAEVNTK